MGKYGLGCPTGEVRKNVCILMMSALHEAAGKCKAAGADDFIAKPFETQELLERLEKMLGKSKD